MSATRRIFGVGVTSLASVALAWFSLGPPAVPIAVATALSFAAWVRRGATRQVVAERVLVPYLGAVVIQFAHLGEELVGGFHVRFPELFGRQPWLQESFVLLFVLGFGIFYVMTAIGILRGVAIASFGLWFAALGPMLVNSIAHGLVSLWQWGYFPGLITAPIQLVVSLVLVRAIRSATSAEAMPSTPSLT